MGSVVAVDLNNRGPRSILRRNDGCHENMGGANCCCCCERALTKEVDCSTLVPHRKKKNGRLLVFCRVIFLLTLPFSLMEPLVMSCASFDRTLKTFFF